MKKFFICTSGIAKGPFQLEELINYGLNEMDLIWSRDWGISKYAFEIEELKGYFRRAELLHQPANYSIIPPQSNSSVLKNTVLFSLLFILAGLITYYFININ